MSANDGRRAGSGCRDLHPGNILVRRRDGEELSRDTLAEAVRGQLQLILLDFGLAEELTPLVRNHFLSFLHMVAAGEYPALLPGFLSHRITAEGGFCKCIGLDVSSHESSKFVSTCPAARALQAHIPARVVHAEDFLAFQRKHLISTS